MKLFDIIINHNKSEWERLIKENCDIEYIEKDYLRIDGINCQFTFDDLQLSQFPFNIGDEIALKDIKGNFKISALPFLDDRTEIGKEEDKFSLITEYGNVYWIYGTLENGTEAATEMTESEEQYIRTNQCQYCNFKKKE